MESTRFIRYTQFVLVFVFLVILAGGVVRMTQSGMGCPDWPRCFGSWIPPTSADQLPADYEKYLSQQDIDHTFNAYHTWIEYVNRLLGALLGIWILILVIWSYRKFYKTNRSIFWWSIGLLLLTGFQGWLGKKVVDANLAVVKVTTHMLVALLIAAIPVIIIHKLRKREVVESKPLLWLCIAAIVASIIQIVFGTEVREQIDEISRSLRYEQRELWLNRLDVFYDIHRGFSWVVALLCVFLFWRSLSFEVLQKNATAIFLLVLAVMALGLSMMYFQIPAIAQPLHLLTASILAVVLFNHSLRLRQ